MKKTTRVIATLGSLWVLGPLPTEALQMETLQIEPSVIFARDATKTIFYVRVKTDPKENLEHVRLLQLQGDGSLKEVSDMRDDGTRSDRVENDGIYSCLLTLKQPGAGMLSFVAEAKILDQEPVRTRSAFVNIIGGIAAKEKNSMLKMHAKARRLYSELEKQKGITKAKKETTSWLIRQPGVLAVRPGQNNDLFIQYDSGVGMILHAPEVKKTR